MQHRVDVVRAVERRVTAESGLVALLPTLFAPPREPVPRRDMPTTIVTTWIEHTAATDAHIALVLSPTSDNPAHVTASVNLRGLGG